MIEYEYNRRGEKTKVQIAETAFPECSPEYDLCLCPQTGAVFERRDGIVLGSIIPNVLSNNLCHPNGYSRWKYSKQLFDESEQNCNTCAHLTRVPFVKRGFVISGLMPGKCSNIDRNPLYPRGGEDILFAPDDCMLQSCYRNRLT